MTDPIIIGHGFRERLKELKDEVDRRLLSGHVDPVIAPVPDPETKVSCPFCGGRGRVASRVHWGHGDCTCEVFVECENCTVKGPSTADYGTPTAEQKRLAVQLWERKVVVK